MHQALARTNTRPLPGCGWMVSARRRAPARPSSKSLLRSGCCARLFSCSATRSVCPTPSCLGPPFLFIFLTKLSFSTTRTLCFDAPINRQPFERAMGAALPRRLLLLPVVALVVMLARSVRIASAAAAAAPGPRIRRGGRWGGGHTIGCFILNPLSGLLSFSSPPSSSPLPSRPQPLAMGRGGGGGRGGGEGGKLSKGKKKGDLPEKTCVVCGRPFTWRAKWAKVSKGGGGPTVRQARLTSIDRFGRSGCDVMAGWDLSTDGRLWHCHPTPGVGRGEILLQPLPQPAGRQQTQRWQQWQQQRQRAAP